MVSLASVQRAAADGVRRGSATGTTPFRPTAGRVLRALRDGGPWYVDQLAAHLSTNGRRPIRPATVAIAPRELHATGLAAVDVDDQDELAGRWSALPVAPDPRARSAHDSRDGRPGHRRGPASPDRRTPGGRGGRRGSPNQ